MCQSRPSSSDTLKQLFKAIRADNHTDLENIIKRDAVDVNQSISVYISDYAPTNSSLFNQFRKTTTKTLAQIAADMGHAHCLQCLIQNGANILPVYNDSMEKAAQPRDKLSAEMVRLMDDKTNYKNVAFVMMAAFENLSPEMQAKFVEENAEKAEAIEKQSSTMRP